MSRQIRNPNAETRHNMDEEEFVTALAPQYQCSRAQFHRWAIGYVLDNVSHNDFAKYIAQRKDDADKRMYDDKDEKLRAEGKEI